MSNYCVNPFKLHGSAKYSKRRVSESVLSYYPDLFKIGDFICDKCNIICLKKKGIELPEEELRKKELSRKRSSEEKISGEEYSGKRSSGEGPSGLRKELSKKTIIKPLNDLLEVMDQEPINSIHYSSPRIAIYRIDTLSRSLKIKLIDGYEEEVSFESEVLSELRQKFQQLTLFRDKIHLLTILPNSWSAFRIQNTFNCSKHLALSAKKLKNEYGILCYSNKKKGKSITEENKCLVEKFYKSDEVSRMMPGKKDCVSVKRDGIKISAQKRLVLCNLKELYVHFKKEHPTLKIGFSKFAELRPQECILAGAGGTHSVCVCVIHQNVKLMIQGAKLAKYGEDVEDFPTTYQCILSQMMCNPPTTHCHLQVCDKCPGFAVIKTKLEALFLQVGIESVSFNEWKVTDRTSMEFTEYNPEDYIKSLEKRMILLQKHDFISKMQSSFFQETKGNLKSGEFLVVGDFSENYSFLIQNEIQSYHWSNKQVTIHPFVIYYKNNDDIDHQSIVFISENLHHNTVAVHLFQTKLINYLKAKFKENINKIIYFSDGAASQYKNKSNFINIAHHVEDFGLDSEWHFFATSHGKNACDGVGGTVKRLASRANLQRDSESQILNPKQLFTWAKETIHNMDFEYCTNEEHENHEKLLKERFEKAKPVKGTRGFHAVYPTNSNNQIRVKIFSDAEFFETVKIM